MAVCKSCGADILWIRTRSGKLMPVNRKRCFFMKSKSGNETFVTEGGDVLRGTRTAQKTLPAMVGYTSHFATCPNAASHRKK
ncbi:MAG: hypothetical protein IJH05_05885 [Firmicutes bacterium]|nr:hypothetical protein [Bacillota bacterium]